MVSRLVGTFLRPGAPAAEFSLYWHLYERFAPHRFAAQIHRALGGYGANWEKLAFAGLVETTERLATTQGLARWG